MPRRGILSITPYKQIAVWGNENQACTSVSERRALISYDVSGYHIDHFQDER